MKSKHNNAPSSIITRDLSQMQDKTGNLYEAINVISRRSKQISVDTKEELNEKLAEFASSVDNLEEVFENREQIEISKSYEKMPKSTNIATEEFLADKLNYRYPDEEEKKKAEEGEDQEKQDQ